jgi:hypothetical protein
MSADPSLRERFRFIEFRGTRMLLSDLSGITESEELRRVLEEGVALVRQEPPRSLLVLVRVHGIPYSLENVLIVRRAVRENVPFVKARAIVGMAQVAMLSLGVAAHLFGQTMYAFDDEEKAKLWLLQHAATGEGREAG